MGMQKETQHNTMFLNVCYLSSSKLFFFLSNFTVKRVVSPRVGWHQTPPWSWMFPLYFLSAPLS